MTLRLNSTGGGHIEIDAPNTASNFSVTMPALAGDVVVADASGDIETTRTGTGGSSGSALVVGYQQGDWTPALSGGYTDLNTTYGSQWSRIGNIVTVNGRLVFNKDEAGKDSSTNIEVLDLPYSPPSAGVDGSVWVGSVMTQNLNDANGRALVAYPTSSGVRIYYASSGSNYASVSYSSFKTGTSSSFIFSVSYRTEDTTWTPQNGATVS